jgi:hypothetical protein
VGSVERSIPWRRWAVCLLPTGGRVRRVVAQRSGVLCGCVLRFVCVLCVPVPCVCAGRPSAAALSVVALRVCSSAASRPRVDAASRSCRSVPRCSALSRRRPAPSTRPRTAGCDSSVSQ